MGSSFQYLVFVSFAQFDAPSQHVHSLNSGLTLLRKSWRYTYSPCPCAFHVRAVQRSHTSSEAPTILS